MNIVESIKSKIIAELESSKEATLELKGKRAVISIIEGTKVMVKIFDILPKREAKRYVPETKEREAIKVIKKSVKVNTDISFLLTLLDDVKASINALNFKYITNEAAEEIRQKIESLDSILGKTTLRLEKLPNTKREEINGN
jgi:hypothetical protein